MPSEHRLRLDDHWKSSKSLPKWHDTSKKQWCFSYNQDFHLCTHITRLFHLHVQPCFCNRQTADLWVQNCSGLVSLLHKTFFQNSTGLSRFIIAYSCLELFLYSVLNVFPPLIVSSCKPLTVNSSFFSVALIKCFILCFFLQSLKGFLVQHVLWNLWKRLSAVSLGTFSVFI